MKTRFCVFVRTIISVTSVSFFCTTISVGAASRTWDGSYSLYWSASANWVENITPVNGDDLIFPAGTNSVSINNINSLTVRSITISGTGYSLEGSGSADTITLMHGIDSTAAGSVNTVELNLNLAASQNVECDYSNAELFLNGNIDLGSYTLTTIGAGQVHLGGAISGSGGITKNGSGTHWLEGGADNTYTGPTVVNSGELNLNKSSGDAVKYGSFTIGNGVGGDNSTVVLEMADFQIGNIPLYINSDGKLDLDDYYDTVGDITLNGGVIVSSGSGTLALGGDVSVLNPISIIAGHIYLGGSSRTFDIAASGIIPSPGAHLIVSAAVSGTGDIVKSGDGIMSLGGSNTFSGTTTVEEGQILVESGNAFGSTAGGTTVQTGGQITLSPLLFVNELQIGAEPLRLYGLLVSSTGWGTNLGTNEWGGPITLFGEALITVHNQFFNLPGVVSGAGGIVKDGEGALIFSGASANTFAGDTVVNAGTLYLDKDPVDGALPGPGDLIIGDEVYGIEFDQVVELQSYQIASSVDIQLTRFARLDLNNFNDAVGGLVFDVGGHINTGTGTITLGGDVVMQGSLMGVLLASISGNLSLGSVDRIFDIDPSGMVIAPGSAFNVTADVSGSGGMIKEGAAGMALYGNNTYSGVTTVNDGTLFLFSDSALGGNVAGTVVSAGARLYLYSQHSYPPVQIGNEALEIAGDLYSLDGNNPSVTNAWNGPITLTGETVVDVFSNGFLNVSGTVSGSGGMVKAGGGIMIMSGSSANTYTGNTVINEGVLALDKQTGYEAVSAGSLTIGDGVGGLQADVVRAENFHQIGDLPVRVNNSGMLDLNNYTDYLTGLTLDGGRVSSGTGHLALSGDVTVVTNSARMSRIAGRVWLPSGIREFSVGNSTAFPDLRMDATVEGPGGFRKTGTGSMLLYASNIYEGETLVDEGAVGVYDSDALGDVSGGTVVAGGATLIVNDNSQVPAEPLTVGGSGLGAYGAVDSYIGTNFWKGAVTLTGDTLVRIKDSADSLSFSGSIGGSGGITKTGAGTLVFSGASVNSYSGDTVVELGVLELDKSTSDGAIPGGLIIGDGNGGAGADIVRLAGSNQIDNDADVTIVGSGLFDLGGYYDRIDSVTGKGSVEVAAGGYLIAGHNDSNFTFDGLISGNGYIWKVGNGTWTLTGNNTYAGNTKVEYGTLMVNGSHNPSSDVAVHSAATLGGIGSVGAVTCAGTVAPGNSAGQLGTDNMAFTGGGAAFAVELDGHTSTEYDRLDVNGVALLGNADLDVSWGFVPAQGDSFLVIDNDGSDAIMGTFNGLPDGSSVVAGNVTLKLTYAGGDGNDVELLAADVQPLENLEIISVDSDGGNIDLDWEGGVPFFLVEKKTSLTNAIWTPVTTATRDFSGSVPADTTNGFYRVTGGN